MVLDITVLQWVVIIGLIWLAVVTALLVQSMLHYRRLTKNITKKDLKSILSEILSRTTDNEKQLKDLSRSLGKLQLDTKAHIQKIGFIRFNPFSQTGGDQSFVLALLDDTNSGLVLSSFHTRDTTRLYAKPIKNGQGDGYELSKEEKQSIKKAK